MIRRIRFGDPIIVVSGLPRSGTSMTMKMLEAGGVSVVIDGIRTADDDNPKGYFELEQVKDLDKGDARGDMSWLNSARGKTVKIISYLLEHLPDNHNYKVIFMRRDLTEILASQAKMLRNRGEANETDDDRMIDIYKNHLIKIKVITGHRPWFDILEVNYRDVIQTPLEEARRINEFLGGRLDVQKMATAVDEKLYRNRARAS